MTALLQSLRGQGINIFQPQSIPESTTPFQNVKHLEDDDDEDKASDDGNDEEQNCLLLLMLFLFKTL